MARNLIAITSLIAAIALTSYLLFKSALLTTSYILGFAGCIFLSFMSGYAITRMETIDFQKVTDQYRKRLDKYKEEYERGKATVLAPNPIP